MSAVQELSLSRGDECQVECHYVSVTLIRSLSLLILHS